MQSISRLNRKALTTCTIGQPLIFQCCKLAGVDVIVHKNDEEATFEQTLCHDVMTLMAVFSAKLYGRRSHQKRCGV